MAISRLESSRFVLGTASIIGGGLAVFAVYKYLRPKLISAYTTSKKKNVYESEKLLNEYLTFHYGGCEVNCLHQSGPQNGFDFPRRCADLCIEHFEPSTCSNDRALDIGCAVGRSTFELAKVFRECQGIDFSFGFVRTCEVLAKTGKIEYEALVEGDITTKHNADRSRCIFKQGDACNLPLDIGQFGCVLAANLICRLPDPRAFLLRLANLVAPGGICVITSPYTFMREYTPRKRWIGGYQDIEGNEVRAFTILKDILGTHFELVDSVDMPFLIRETARKHQWTVAHATVWKRKTSI